MSPEDPAATAGIRVPAPFLFAAALGLGFALDWVWPTATGAPAARIIAGPALVGAGAVVLTLAFREMARHGVQPDPRRPVPSLVTGGPYRLSWNPFYVAFAAITAGIGVWAGSLWVVGLVVPALILCHRWVIRARGGVSRRPVRRAVCRLPGPCPPLALAALTPPGGRGYTRDLAASVAQLVRASVCGTGGRGFNSRRSPQLSGP